MPLSDYKLIAHDKSIERFYQDFADEMELLNTSSYMLGDQFLLGECAPLKTWDEVNKKWRDISLIPPEKIEVRKTYVTKKPILLLHVDSELKRLVNSSDPVDIAIRKQMDPDLVKKIMENDRIVLPPAQASFIANKTSESDLRGTSILKRGLYALLLKYKIRVLHNAYMDRGTYPIKLWKMGSESQKWIPTKAHFDALRQLLAAQANDPAADIIFHFGLNLEVHDQHANWQDLIQHYDFCDREMMVALFGNQSLMQSQPSSYNNANISVRILLSRYQMIRSQLELFWKNQIFRPMAEARNYWVRDSTGSLGAAPSKEINGKFYYLDMPKFKWAKLNLIDDTAQKQFLMRLRERTEISHKTICDLFDFDSQEMLEQIKREEGTHVDPTFVKVKDKAAMIPTVMSQVLVGRKSKDWVLPEDLPENEAKKEKDSNEAGKPPKAVPGVTPQGTPDTPFPVSPMSGSPAGSANATAPEAPGPTESPI